MTFPTANVRVKTGPLSLFAKSCNLDPALESGSQRTGHLTAQLHEFARIRPADTRDWTGTAQVTRPGSTQQATFLMVTTAVIVAVEVLAFRSSWRFHFTISKLPQFLTYGRNYLHAGQVFTGTGVNANGIADFDEVRALHLITGLNFYFFGYTGGSISAHSHFSINDFEIH
jgi:hypothetical protein